MGILQSMTPKVSFASLNLFEVSLDFYSFLLLLNLALLRGCLVPSVQLNWGLFLNKPLLRILSVTKIVLHREYSGWAAKLTLGASSPLNLL